MANPFMLRLLTPDASIFEDNVEAVVVPGENGEFGVLAGHTKFITTLIPGILKYVHDGQTLKAAVGGGFAEVYPDGVTVLADTLERPEDIDTERSERSRTEVLKALEKKGDLGEAEVAHLEARLARAENRLRAARLKSTAS